MTKRVRVTISLPEELVDRIDLAARHQRYRGMRSKVVQQLIRDGVTKSGVIVARDGNEPRT